MSFFLALLYFFLPIFPFYYYYNFFFQRGRGAANYQVGKLQLRPHVASHAHGGLCWNCAAFAEAFLRRKSMHFAANVSVPLYTASIRSVKL